jgi:peptidoglycan/LPS O-acetylase OafA/YrhL
MRGPIYAVAVASYSVYLTHALMIHVARAFTTYMGGGLATYFLAAAGLIVLGGWAFYACIERPSVNLREVLAPKAAIT